MMNNEEFDRKMEFILNQQAQFAVDIQRLREAQAAAQALTDEKLARAAESAADASDAAAQASRLVLRTVEGLDNLSRVVQDGFRYTFDSFKETNAKINALVDSQILTNEKLGDTTEKLGDLTVLVNRHISEGHTGIEN
jgi:hypothetical protein